MASKFKEYGEILTFFVFETLAFTAFSLGNSVLLYFLFGILTLMMIVLFNTHRLKDLDWMYYLIFMIPFVLFGVLSGFNKFTLDSASSHFNLATNLISCLALLTFISVGFLSKTISNFKITSAMMVIYGGLSIIVLISICYAMVKYVPFYTMIYNGQYIYYEGTRYPIWDNIPFLMGFEFHDVSIQYFQLFATMLFTSIVGLRYISPKKETKKFIFYVLFASIGFLSMIFTINKINIITSVLVIFFLLFLVFCPKNKKVLKPIFYTIVGLVGVALMIFFINAQSEWGFASGLQNLIAGNKFLNKIFNANRFSTPVKALLDGCLKTDNLFSRVFNPNLEQYFTPSGMFLFDAVIYSGTLGGIFLVIFLIFSFINVVKYYNNSKDDMLAKNLVVGFIGSFFLYAFFALDSKPYCHYDNNIPMNHNCLFFITLFLIGYTFQGREKYEEKLALVNDEITMENNENIALKNEGETLIKEPEISELDKEEENNEKIDL